jgi:hypothetical protein
MEYDLNVEQCEKNLEKARLERPPSYSIVLDNFDIMVHSADMTSDHQNKDYHWCNHNAVLDRINPIEDDCKPKQSLSDTPNITFVPSLKEQSEIINDLVIMVARVLVEHFNEFQSFKNVVPKGRCENPECRNITEYGGISRNMAEYHGIWRNITEYHNIFPEYTGTSQYFPMVAMRLFINMDV